jgi:hypothetical protein
MIQNAVTAVAQWAEVTGKHCYVAGLIPTVTPKYCTKECSLEHKCRIYNSAQQIIYVNRPKKTLKGNFTASQEGLSESSLLRSDGFQNSQAGGWTS